MSKVINEQDVQVPDTRLVNMGSDKNDYRIDILKEDNYVTWKWHMSMVLDTKGMLEYVTNPDKKTEQRSKQAATLIGSALSDDNKQMVINCDNAYDIWKSLESYFENKSSSERSMLMEQFHSFRINSIQGIGKGIGELKAKVAKLKQLGANIDDEQVVSVLLKALPESLNSWKRTWKMINGSCIDLNKLTSGIMAEVNDVSRPADSALVATFRREENGWKRVENRKRFNKSKSKTTNARRNDGERSMKNEMCNYCKKFGHWARDCRKLKASRAEEKPKADSDMKEANKTVSFMAVADHHKLVDTVWIADSGCSSHMTMHKKWLTDYEQLAEPTKITLGNHQHILAYGSGKIITPTGDINSVLYVPDVSANLFSISAATSHGIQAICTKDAISFYKDDREITRAYKSHGIYLLHFEVEEPESSAYAAATLDEWHERFGHISIDKIRQMADNKVVEHLDLARGSSASQCTDCALGKCKRAHHPLRTTQSKVESGESLHLDTVGPMKQASLKGSRYTILCKDEASNYRLVKFVETKDMIPDEVKQIISKAIIESGRKVRQIVTDNGTEFVNDNLRRFLREDGIQHIVSVPYTPQQNGFIERDIRTIFEAARVILNKSELSKELWAEAVNTSVYTMNRSVNSSNQVKTPFELWFGMKPSVKNLRIFGQQAVVLYKSNQRSKWDDKGTLQTFVGYTERFNTYRFYDAMTHSVYESCDAIFLSDNGAPMVTSSIGGTIEITAETEGQIGEPDDDDTIIDESSTEIQVPCQDTFDRPSADIQEHTPQPRQETEPHRTSPIRKPCPCPQIPKPSQVHSSNIIASRLRPILERKKSYHAKLSTIESDADPKSYSEAMSRSDSAKWLDAMKEEITSLKKNEVWQLVERPRHNVVSNKWVLKIKRKPNGEIERYKARLVARGFSQVPGVDYQETYAPVANMTSIRMLFAFAAIENLKIAQFDVKTAFLYGDLDETVYMEQPQGFEEDPNKVCQLKRSLYGLKQSPRQWNIKFTNFLKEMNLAVSEHDSCIFYRKDPLLIIGIYVDDGIMLAENQEEIQKVMSQLRKRFEVHSVGSSAFLGFQIYRGTAGEIILHQASYISAILKRFNMIDAKSVDAPISLTKSEEDTTPLEDTVPYREAIGSLMYAAVTTRPDIAYAVGRASRNVENPTVADWTAVKRIFRYLKDKEYYGLKYSRGSSKTMVVYCDADFAGDPMTSRSTTGSVFVYGGGPIQWRSQRQPLITLSSTEAEFVSICSTVKETVYIRKLGNELNILDDGPSPIYCDNQSAIRIGTNEKSSHRTRHMSVQANYPREQAERGEVEIKFVKSSEQLADMLTKPTTIQKFVSNNSKLMTLSQLALFMICMMMLVSPMQGYIFDREKTIMLIPMDHKIEANVTEFELDFTFINPCQSIPTSNLHRNTNSAYTESDYTIFRRLFGDCQRTYEEKWLSAVQQIETVKHTQAKRAITKRSVFLPILGAMVLISVVSNLITSTFQAVKEPVLQDAQNIIKIENQRMDAFESAFNASREVNEGILNTTELLTKRIETNEQSIKRLQELLPHLAWQSSHLHSKIIGSSELLRRVMIRYQDRRLDTDAVTDLWNMTEFRKVNSKDTLLESVTRLTNSTLRFRFNMREASADTTVYKIFAFNHWRNVTETPTYMRYDGYRYAIYNATSNCSKVIDEPRETWVLGECLEVNSSDPRIESWTKEKATENEAEQNHRPTVKKTLNYNYIYCYGHNITIEGKQVECPLYPFKLKIGTPFSTTDHKYTPSVKRITMTMTNDDFDISDKGPLVTDQTEKDINEVNMLRTIKELRARNKEIQIGHETSISIERYGTIWWIGLVLSVFTTAVTLINVILWCKGHIVRIPSELSGQEAAYASLAPDQELVSRHYPHLENELKQRSLYSGGCPHTNQRPLVERTINESIHRNE